MTQANTSGQPGGAPSLELTEFESLLKKEFKPKTSAAQEAINAAVRTLAEQALAATTLVSDDAVKSIEAIIAGIDRVLTQQLNLILHHPDFQALEATWRGLYHLVSNTETDETLKIRVLNISKKELGKTLGKFKGAAWDQSPLFKKLYEEEYGMPGGQPYGLLVGDYAFDHTPPDVEILQGMGQIAAASFAPFIAAASPTLMGMDSWQGLTMPRFLARLPYGAKTNPVDEFAFEEDTEGAKHDKYVWANAAYAFATNVTRAFKLYGWCARIRGVESGGMVEGLPCHTFPTDDGGVDMKCPTEIAITDRREAELAKNGLMPLSHWKNTDYAVFMGAQSLQKPQEYDDPDATANARLSANLTYLFATCRFAHFLKCIVRDKIGSFKEREDMLKWLNRWIMQYVEPDPANASEEAKARRPLAAAEVQVEEIPGNPGYYSAKFFLRPHYQLEGLTVSLRLVSKLPSAKKA